MKKIISIALAIVFLSIIFPVNASASTYLRRLTPKIAAQYVSKKSDYIESCISEGLNSLNENSVKDISGKISLSYPFPMAVYRPNYPDESKYTTAYKFYQYSAVIYNNEVIGLLEIEYSNNDIETKFYVLSESSYRSLDDGISFYWVTNRKPNTGFSIGGIPYQAFSLKSPNKKGLLSYYDSSILADEETRTLMQNDETELEQPSGMTKLSEINYIDSSTEIIYSFDFTPDTDHIIKDGEKYLIISKDGLFLTYENGKYFLSEYLYNNSDKQTFIISEIGDYFKISPSEYPEKYLSIKSDNEFSLNLSYFNNYCYSVAASSNSKLVMTANAGKALFSSYQSGKYDASSQDWYIIPA